MRTFDPARYADADVLLVAPHPDDEALGAGGTLALLARAGARVRVVVGTTGAAGIAGTGADPGRRAREAAAACAQLGVGEPLLLGLASPSLRADPLAAAARLTAAVGPQSCDLALAPGPLERHASHRAALLALLLADCGRPGAAVFGYGVWDAVPALPETLEVDVTAVRAAKVAAVSAHGSQQEGRALAAGIAGRDGYHAVFSRLVGAEERRAVERLLDLGALAAAVRALRGQAPAGGAGAAGAGPDGLAARVRRLVGAWTADRLGAAVEALWAEV